MSAPRNVTRAALMVGLAMGAVPGSSQSNTSAVPQFNSSIYAHRRTQCRLAVQVLRSGHLQNKHEWAQGYISACHDEGPSVIAELWPGIGTGERELDALTYATIRLRDVRTYDAVRRTATDRSRPAAVRVAAMVVLERYVNRNSAVSMVHLVPPDTIKRIPLIGASTIHSQVSNGSQPLGPVAPEVLSLFQTLASARDKEPREVWYAAAVLARRVGAP